MGFIDGTVIFILNPPDPDVQNAFYNGMDRNAAVKCLFVFGVDGTIIFAVTNELGAKHDATLLAESGLMELLDNYDPGLYLLGDVAFPSSQRLLRPLSELELRALPEDQRGFLSRLDRLVSRLRVCAEWGLSSMKNTFRVLKGPLTTDHAYRARIFRCCTHLHNLRVRIEHVGQIAAVFNF